MKNAMPLQLCCKGMAYLGEGNTIFDFSSPNNDLRIDLYQL